MMNDHFWMAFTASFWVGLVILVTFILWFQLRDRPKWDLGLFVVASIAFGFFLLLHTLLQTWNWPGMGFGIVPVFGLYGWFFVLWRTRQERASIYRWGQRHGFHITSLDRIEVYRPGSRYAQSEYRIVARGVSDGRIRVGRVIPGVPGRSQEGFEVLWEGEVKPIHLHRPQPHPEKRPEEGGPRTQ
jgi:hypothetical protein